MLVTISSSLCLLVNAAETKSLRANLQKKLSSGIKYEPSDCPYPGSYCDSCPDCKYVDTAVICKCYNTHGQLCSWTVIDSTNCKGYIENHEGMLICEHRA